MKLLLNKEMRLTASPLSYIFIAFALMTMIPQYPILVGAFFVCFGVFHTFQSAREAGDTIYTAMLPVAKADVVKAKYIFTVFVQLVAFALMAVLTAVRMCFMAVPPYTTNALMNANLAYLGFVLMIYTAFNLLFICGFYKTAYKIGIPFTVFGIVAFVMIAVAEALKYFPGMGGLNDTLYRPEQLVVLVAGVAVYAVGTILGMRLSIKRFDRIDL